MFTTARVSGDVVNCGASFPGTTSVAATAKRDVRGLENSSGNTSLVPPAASPPFGTLASSGINDRLSGAGNVAATPTSATDGAPIVLNTASASGEIESVPMFV